MKVKGGGKKKNVAASSEGLEDDPTTPVANGGGGGKRCGSRCPSFDFSRCGFSLGIDPPGFSV